MEGFENSSIVEIDGGSSSSVQNLYKRSISLGGQSGDSFNKKFENLKSDGSKKSWKNCLRNCTLVSYNTRIYSRALRSQVSVAEERMRHLSTFPSTIHPYSDLRWYVEILMTIILILALIGQPLQITFYSASLTQADSAVLSLVVSIFFLTDIILNFKTGIILHERDEIVLDSRIIALNYLRGWFFIDFISSIPYDSIYVAINDLDGNEQVYFKYFRMLELLKIFRIARVVRYLSRIEMAFQMDNLYTRIVNLLTMMAFLIHWLGCMHYLVADMVNNTPPYTRNKQSWVSQMDMWDNPVWEKYAHCILRALSNMACLGYGFIEPRSPEDVLATIVSILIGATCFALYIAHISNIVLNLDSSRNNYNESLKQAQDYMKFKRMPKELQERVEHYYEQRYRRNLFNEQGIMTNVSDVLRHQLKMFNCQRLIEQVPLFKGLRTEILREIVAQLKFEVYLPKDVIIHENTIGDSMYFIEHGRVSVLGRTGKVLTTLKEGSFFGEMALVTEARRVADVIAMTSCDVYRLEKCDFERVVHQYPEVYESFVQVAKKRERRQSVYQLPLDSDETVTSAGKIAKRKSVPHVAFEAKRKSVPDLELDSTQQ